MGVCLKFHEKWAPKHRSRCCSIRDILVNSLKGGVSAVKLVSYLAKALDDEVESGDEDVTHTHYREQSSDTVEEFYLYHLFKNDELDEKEEDSIDKSITTQHISYETNL